jgi:hypothetical protein
MGARQPGVTPAGRALPEAGASPANFAVQQQQNPHGKKGFVI